MKKSFVITIVAVVMLLTQTNIGYGYSYGDPNEEKVAEVYKQMIVKLNEEPPNFQAAKDIFDTVKAELDMHMGTEPGEVVLHSIKNKDKDAIINAMEKVLVLNISRRLENVETNFQEYDTSKKLLAKGFATYKALSPVVQEKNVEVDKKLQQEFNAALESLGNPGLFGVGKKEANIDAFKDSKNTILKELQQEFNLKSLDVGHFSESATEDNNQTKEQGEKVWTDYSQLKNWIPIIILVAVIVAVIVFVRKRKR